MRFLSYFLSPDLQSSLTSPHTPLLGQRWPTLGHEHACRDGVGMHVFTKQTGGNRLMQFADWKPNGFNRFHWALPIFDRGLRFGKLKRLFPFFLAHASFFSLHFIHVNLPDLYASPKRPQTLQNSPHVPINTPFWVLSAVFSRCLRTSCTCIVCGQNNPARWVPKVTRLVQQGSHLVARLVVMVVPGLGWLWGLWGVWGLGFRV